MLDIDKELKALSKIKHSPGDSLRQSTRDLVQNEARHMRTGGRREPAKPAQRIVRWAAVCTAAAAVVLFAALMLSPVHTAQAAGYYTVDINPSVTLSVDENDVVLWAVAANEDAAALLEDMKLIGLPISDALDALVRAAAEGGWLADSGHVLVAHFGNTPGISEQQANDIVSNAAGDSVNVLVLQSTKEDYEATEGQHQNAGLELLKKNAQSLDIDDSMDVDDVISAIAKKQNQQNSNGQGSHKPNNPQATEKPSSTPKPSVTPDHNNGKGGQQDNEKDNADKPDKQKDNGKPDKDGSGDSGNNGQGGGNRDDKKKNNSQGGGKSGDNRKDKGKDSR